MYNATDRSSGIRVAVKRATVPDQDFIDFGVEESVLREISMMRMLPEHDHIIRLVRVFASNHQNALRIHTIMPLADCDLYAFRRKHHPLSAGDMRRITAHIARGLHFLHSHGIVHGDIKSSNVLMFGTVAKIADLGTSCSFVQVTFVKVNKTISDFCKSPQNNQ